MKITIGVPNGPGQQHQKHASNIIMVLQVGGEEGVLIIGCIPMRGQWRLEDYHRKGGTA